MTASEQRLDAHALTERALDVLVYLPAGAFLTAVEEMPETIAKGKARVDQELRNAKIVGRFAVGVGWRQLKEQIERLAAEGRGPARPAATGAGIDAAAPSRHRKGAGTATGRPASTPKQSPAATATPSRRITPARDPEVDRVIPDYDILAASQVVRRLDGLGHDELRAVLRHERATRGRRTILHRAEQLLGDHPGNTG